MSKCMGDLYSAAGCSFCLVEASLSFRAVGIARILLLSVSLGHQIIAL